ncbi:hypothetical protein LAZ67_1007370 [Cordylochernes scorpioides]|uniref:Transposase n=1 Tax=Cordylochernes scorpioides TaxID=51811 RepID=A0ABY6K451_9ARAC|nr:hypothetical protein LAZ67_1007370 [Cordylochernes scorpioides]
MASQGFINTKETKDNSFCWKSTLDYFWESKGCILEDYLPKGQTVNRIPKICSKRRGLLSKGVCLKHDNDRSQALIHPPYSPDLAPSNYYLFGHLKRFLRGMTSKTDNEVKNEKSHPRKRFALLALVSVEQAVPLRPKENWTQWLLGNNEIGI